ncbi:MAG: flagellar biosynthetic protein FliR [Betaproteobacteria bacterium]|nr:flagellar biosynthetic protein FliR [Betaproteobacteria bacterium]
MLSVTSAQWSAWIAAFIFPLARILAVVASTPILGDREVPLQARIGLALLLTILVSPSLQVGAGLDPGSAQGLLVLVQQILIGTVMGFSIRVIFAAVEMAGEVTGLQMGLGFASFYDPQNASFQPVLSQFLGVLMSLLFLSMNGHLYVLSALADSFQNLPISAVPPPALGLHTLVSWAGSLFLDALQIALPLLAVLMMANIALGILTRSSPQLNLFAVGFPITLAAGFVALTLSLPYLNPLAERFVKAGFVAVQHVLGQLALH